MDFALMALITLCVGAQTSRLNSVTCEHCGGDPLEPNAGAAEMQTMKLYVGSRKWLPSWP